VDTLSKRRKERDPDQPRGFDAPEFDEPEFIRKEVISFRAALVLLLWSLVAALVSFVVWLTVAGEGLGWYTGLIIAAGMGYMLRWILPALKVDISHFKKKEWFGTGALFFFSWLAFFILVMNPPIYDGVAPDLEIHITPSAQEPGGFVNITLIATDNIAVDHDSMVFAVYSPQGQQVASTEDLWLAVENDAGVWAWGFTPQENGTYRVEASVRDTGGGSLVGGAHERIQVVDFLVGDVVEVRMSGMDAQGVGHLTSTRDAITVHLPGDMDVYRAYLEVTRPDNTSAPVFLEFDEARSTAERQEWFAHPGFEGFAQGENRFRVVVEEHSTYYLELRFAGLGPMSAPLVTDEEYLVRIPDQGLLGDQMPELPDQRDPAVQPIPGPAPLVVLALLVGWIVWRRRRRG
jgi:hypothetical protein